MSLWAAAVLAAAPSREYPIRAVPPSNVQLIDGFWKQRGAPVAQEPGISTAEADFFASTIGAGTANATVSRDGIELALIRLWIETGRPRYYETARFLLDRRRAAQQAPPHATDASAMYLYAAMTDVAALENDKAYLDAVSRIWRDVAATPLLITGEPVSPLWSSRMFLTTGRSEYIDVLERALYNRLLPGVSGYIYAHRSNTVFVNLFAGSRARIPMALGGVTITQETGYPWDGDVEIRVEPEQAREFVIALREPRWISDTPMDGDRYRYADRRRLPPPAITVNGSTPHMLFSNGYITIGRRWEKGDVVRMKFAMQPRRVVAGGDTGTAGTAMFERGPIVYVLDAADRDVVVPVDAKLESSFRRSLHGGVTVVTGEGLRGGRRARFTAIPYFALH